MPFTRSGLERAGFEGWTNLGAVHGATGCPVEGGLYVVTRPSRADPLFLQYSVGGAFKGRDPTVAREVLEANWVAQAECVYIGQSSNIQRRLKQYADFGAGKPVGHYGGRLIWQLADYANLLVAWKVTPEDLPPLAERELIERFRAVYGKPPFANEPHRLGKQSGRHRTSLTHHRHEAE